MDRETDSELSPLAQSLLAQHRTQDAPSPDQAQRMWNDIRLSALVTPGLVVDPPGAGNPAPSPPTSGLESAGAPAAGPAASSAVPASTAAVATAKGSALPLSKVLLALAVSGSVAGTATYAVRHAQAPVAPQAVQPVSQALQAVPTPQAPPAAPATLPELPRVWPTPKPQASQPDKVSEQLPAEFATQLRLLSNIDDQVRSGAHSQASHAIRQFLTQHPNSPFKADVQALDLINRCLDLAPDTDMERRVRSMRSDAKYRRFWHRLRAACKAPR